MSKIRLQGDASGTGTLTIASPNTNSDSTINLPITLGNAGASAMVTTDASGNLGLGVTPSAWSGATGFQLANGAFVGAAGRYFYIGANTYFNGSWRYTTSSGGAARYDMDGSHAWFVAPSGTAGNAISFTQAMTLDASGNLGIGTTSPGSRLQINGAYRQGGAAASIFEWSVNPGAADFYKLAVVGGADNLIVANTNGNVGIGTSSPTSFGGRNLQINDPANGYAGLLISSGAYVYQTLMSANNGVTSTGMRSNHPLAFTTNDIERARIDTSGNLLVGKSSTSLLVQGSWIAPNGEIYIVRVPTDQVMRFYNASAGTQVGNITVGTTTTTYNTSSDYRLKEDVQPMTGALAKVAALKPVTYKWKMDGSYGEGFIAHELAEVAPQCVSGEKDAIETYTDDDGNEQTRPKYQGIDTSFLVATLTAAIQELKAEFDAYKAAHP